MGDLPIGGVSVEVKADLSKLGPGFAEGKAQAQAFDKDVSASMAKAGSATANLTAHQKALVAQLVATKTTAAEAAAVFGHTADSQKMLAAFTQASSAALKTQASAIGNAAAAQKQLNATVSGGAKTYENFFNGNFVDQWAEQAKATGKSTEAFKLNRAGLQELIGIARHSFDQLASGGSVFRVVGSHAASLAQVVGTSSGGLGGALASLATPTALAVIGIGAVAGATVAAAVAIDHFNAKAREMNALTTGIGRTAGLTAQQIDAIANKNAAAGSVSINQAKQLEQQLLQTGQVSGDVFGRAILIQTKFARAMNVDSKTALAALTSALADPQKGLDLLNSKFGNLSGSQQQAIRDAIDSGNTLKATALIMSGLEDATKNADGALHGLGGAFSFVKQQASNLGTGLSETVRSLEDLLQFGPKVAAQMEAARQAKAKLDAQQATGNRQSGQGLALAQSLNPDFAPQQQLKSQADQLTAGIAGAAITKDTAALTAQQTALANVNRARATYKTDLEKSTALANLDAQAEQVRAQKETATTRAKLGSIAAEKTRIELSGKVMSAAEVETRARNAATVAQAKQSRGANSHAEALAREAAAMVANAKGALALGAAYLVSDSAALRAEASRKASTDATRKGIELEAQIRRQLNLDIAERVAAGDKEVATLRAQAAAQAFANAAVASGAKTVEQAQKAAQDALALRDLQATAEAAHAVVVRNGAKATDEEVAADRAATKALLDKKAALDAVDAGLNLGAAQVAAQASRDQAEILKAEAGLLYASNQERARRIAMLQKEQELRNKPGGAALVASTDGQAAIRAAGDTAAAGAGLGDSQFVKQATDQVKAQRDAYLLNAKAIGMTTEQAAAFEFEQGHLNEAAQRGITLTDDQTAALHKQAGQYGAVTKAALELERQQRAAADAAGYLSDQVSGALEDVLTGSAKASDAIRSVAKDAEKALIHGALTGQGPFAGILGTDKTDGPGQPNKGLLSGLFGKAFGQGKAPTGTATDPLFVQMAGAGGIGGGNAEAASTLGGVFGGADGSVNFGASASDVAGIDALSGATPGPGFDFGGNATGDLFAQAGGDTFLSGLSGVFKENSSGGLVGALKGLFGGSGGAGGIGSWLSKLFSGGGSAGGGIGSWLSGNQGSIGSILGSIAANVAHDGLSPGSISTGLTRHVSPTIFLSAPRLHDGLAPDEFPAILQRGERVSSRRQVAQERMGGGGPVNIYVSTPNADSFRKSDRQIAGSLKRRLAVA